MALHAADPRRRHVDMLVVQVHRERLGVAGTALEHRLADQDEAHPRHAFEALAAGRDKGVEADLRGIDRNAPNELMASMISPLP